MIDQVNDFVFNECFLHTPSMLVNAYRLGTKSENKPRPIKVKCKDEAARWEFLKHINQQFKTTPIFCLLDRSKEVQDEEYKLRLNAKHLNLTNMDEKFRAREMKIQVQTTLEEWVNMKKDPQGHWVKNVTNCRYATGKSNEFSSFTHN